MFCIVFQVQVMKNISFFVEQPMGQGISESMTKHWYCWWFRNQSNQLRLVVYLIIYKLGGGFQHLLFSPRKLGKWFPIWRAYFFQMGWFNHQLVTSICIYIYVPDSFIVPEIVWIKILGEVHCWDAFPIFTRFYTSRLCAGHITLASSIDSLKAETHGELKKLDVSRMVWAVFFRYKIATKSIQIIHNHTKSRFKPVMVGWVEWYFRITYYILYLLDAEIKIIPSLEHCWIRKIFFSFPCGIRGNLAAVNSLVVLEGNLPWSMPLVWI